jgi:hypothetical protein
MADVARPKAARSFSRSVAGVAGRQAQVDPAGCKASHAAKGGTGKHVFVQRIRDERAASGTGKPARRRVLHAAGKGRGEKSEDDKRLPHGDLPRWFVVIVADFTAKSRVSKRFLNRFVSHGTDWGKGVGPAWDGPDRREGEG